MQQWARALSSLPLRPTLETFKSHRRRDWGLSALLGQSVEVHMDPHRDRLYFLASVDALISGGWCLSPSEDSKIPSVTDLGKHGNSTKRLEVKPPRALENSDVAC